MPPPTILILPGWQDSGQLHWQSLWLKKFPNAVKVIQKDWRYPKKQDWVETLNEYIEKYKDNEIILVGHSLACATIAHWANEHATNATTTPARIKGALLVSASDVEMPHFSHDIQGFSPLPLQKLPFKSIVVASEDDVWISLERATYFAKCWGSELVNIGAHGHINIDAGFGEWPEGEKLLNQLKN